MFPKAIKMKVHEMSYFSSLDHTFGLRRHWREDVVEMPSLRAEVGEISWL